MKRIKQSKELNVHYTLDENGCFVIEDYNRSKPFSNFFPGVAGLYGIPMWVFYVNRGQCIASFGIECKDKSMLEFSPANKSYRLTALQGFRTFLKITSGDKQYFWEPFQDIGEKSRGRTSQKMQITSHDLTIVDENKELGVKVTVKYATMPEEPYPALIRQVAVENISKKPLSIEMVDGLPVYLPYGMNDWVVKNMCRTVEAWVRVNNLAKKAPYYHLNVEVNDIPQVKYIHEGHFYFAFDPKKKKPELCDPIIEPAVVFGQATDFQTPQLFRESKHFKLPKVQHSSNRTPCAMNFSKFALSPGREKEIVSLFGYASSIKQLDHIVKAATSKGRIEKKITQNEEVIAHVRNFAATHSSSHAFNQYCSQTFLDNVLRGGLPVSLEIGQGKAVFNVFSRKHGDLERDYNYFMLAPTPFSQGNGNYRDVNQNRRNDLWFNTDVKDNCIINFLSLTQADGYNPLVVKGMSFIVESEKKARAIIKENVLNGGDILMEKIVAGFQPGELLVLANGEGVSLKCSAQDFLGKVLSVCHKQEMADHSEGFWSDHWTYNLDLIESYLAVYPESLQEMLFKKKPYTFYHNSHHVLPRTKRYLKTPNGVRQYHSVAESPQAVKAERGNHKLRTRYGDGDIYYTHLLAKLLCLITNKAATFDPSGIGIEMEADKPNWYDSLNGLPGLLGSALSETLELKRYCLFVLGALDKLEMKGEETVGIFEELFDFILELRNILLQEQDSLKYWNRANDVKEHYRSRVLNGIAGEEHEISAKDIRVYLTEIIKRTDKAYERAKDPRGLVATYFYHDVVKYDKLNTAEDGQYYVMPRQFSKHALPLFLEGFVHAMRVERDPQAALELYKKIKASELFDKKLGMYKVNSDLSSETEEIGRARIFPSGWLENESIWLHMEYKYLLEILRCGLYEEFYQTFKEILVPFLDPAQYGRSTLENSSFIVSSAHQDHNLHGQGFVARLSGSTAEIVHIWLLMNVGMNPFLWDKHQGLQFQFKPILQGWLFTKQKQKFSYLNKSNKRKSVFLPQNTYAFILFGSTLVVYHNPKRVSTYGQEAIVQSVHLTYPQQKQPVCLEGNIVPAPFAQDIRDHKVDRIDVYFQ